jgi:serine/threonine protein kinase
MAEFNFGNLNNNNNTLVGAETQTLNLFASNDGSGTGRSFKIQRQFPAMGSGAEGVTFKGKWGDMPITIKVLLVGNATQIARANHEFNTARRFLNKNCRQRPNLLCFFGMIIGTPTATDEELKFFSPDLEAGSVALIYEYAEGNTLTNYINKFAHIAGPVSGFEKIMHGIMGGLIQLYRLNLVHRDLKSDNIIINEKTGTIKIIDYGTLCLASECEDSTDGTIIYQAPNRLNPDLRFSGEGRLRSPVELPKVLLASDLWAAGSIYYELFAKKRLFETDGKIFEYALSPPSTPLPFDESVFEKTHLYYKFLIERLLMKTSSTRMKLGGANRLLQYALIKRALNSVKSKNALRTLEEVAGLFDDKFSRGIPFSEMENRLIDFTVNSVVESYLGSWEGGRRRKQSRRRRSMRRKTRRTK